MVKFGTKTLPGTVLQIEERDRKIYEERPIPGKLLPSRKQHGAFGEEYVVRGLLTENPVTERAALKALADGASRIFDLEDGSPQIYALMLDPFFRMEAGKLHYELAFAQTSMLELGALSDSPTIPDVLKATVGMALSDTPSISETLKAFKGTTYGQSAIGSQNYPTLEEGVTTYAGTTPMDSTTINTWCTKISAAAPCTVKKIHIYLGAVVGNKRVSIFDNAAPANRLGQSAVFAGTPNAWNEIDLLARAHVPTAATYWLLVTEISGNAEYYGYVTGVSGDGKATATSYVSDPGFPSTLDIAGMTSYTSKLSLHTYAVKIKGWMVRAKKFTLPAEKPIYSLRFYSHVAQGSGRFSIFDEASPKNKKWESGSIALAAGQNEVLISEGTPSSLTLPAADYGVWWQYDDVADAPSYTAGAAGDGRRKAQAYGPYPATISGDESTSELWTEVIVVWEEV